MKGVWEIIAEQYIRPRQWK